MLAVLEPSGHCIGRLVNGNVRATRLKARERLLFHDGGASTFDQMRQSLSRAPLKSNTDLGHYHEGA